MKHRVPGGVSNPSSSGGPRARGATARGRDTSSAAGARVQRAIDSPPHRVGTSSPRTARHLALGRPELSLHGRWLAAVLSCGPGAVLSHEPAAELWKIHPVRHHRIEVSVLPMWCVRPRGIVVHHRKTLAPREVECRYGIPVTSPLVTLIHIGTRLDRRQLESAINQADKRDLVSPEELRAALDDLPRRPGIGVLRELLDRRTFTLTDSELERRFVPLARKAGLPLPRTGWYVNGFKVDFYWPGLGMVVETEACATTAPPPSRRATACATRRTPRQVSHGCGSRASKSGSSRTTCRGRCRRGRTPSSEKP
jgi:hypothetical protein